MQRNALWIAFLFLVTFWFLLKGGKELLNYIRLDTSAPAFLTAWEIKKSRDNCYRISVQYYFIYAQERYESKRDVGNSYPNPWAAEYASSALSKKEWRVWFNHKSPYLSSLEKKFPFKKILSAIIASAVALYFFCISLYVRKKHAHNSTVR